MSDLISRQAAINIIENVPYDWSNIKERTAMVNRFKSLPSAEPKEVVPHRNYKYLSDYWCECGWHLGKKGGVKHCAECGRKVDWNG